MFAPKSLAQFLMYICVRACMYYCECQNGHAVHVHAHMHVKRMDTCISQMAHDSAQDSKRQLAKANQDLTAQCKGLESALAAKEEARARLQVHASIHPCVSVVCAFSAQIVTKCVSRTCEGTHHKHDQPRIPCQIGAPALSHLITVHSQQTKKTVTIFAG